jgi:hypothetical protein
MITQLEVFTPRVTVPPLPIVEGSPATDPIQIKNIDGLGPVASQINTSPYGSIDGEFYSGASTGKRNIVLTIGFNPDWSTQTVEGLRQMIYAYFMPKTQVKLRFTSTHMAQVDIDGYVETCEPNIFSKDPEMQVSIICPKPAFYGSSITVFAGETLALPDGDPTEIEYLGTLPTGFVLSVTPTDAAPTMTDGEVRFINEDAIGTPDIFIVTATIDSTKFLQVSSELGNKYVRQIATPSGIPTSILGKQAPGSIWMLLNNGTNQFRVMSAAPGQAWTIQYYAKYGGI